MVEKKRSELAIGDELHGFILESIDLLKEYQGYGYFFRHRITNMEVYHLANEDRENFFSFLFKTPPVDDRGTPHIIEHCVLAGSKRYPVRDPFMTLLKGSAQTFMNALTFPDFTAYPAASPLEKDFKNLFAVYADAVFNPLLREEVFWQEGIRVEVDEEGELSYKGVVFNEMLGAYSDHESIVTDMAIRSLYPDTPYFYESGGNPTEIVSLNYRQMAGYYASHYHPSNCRLFLYGDQDVEERLLLLDELYLSDYSPINRIEPTPLAKRWNNPKKVKATSPGESSSSEATVTVSWATTLAEDPLEVLTLNTLTEILLGNPGAPLYKAIIESGLAKDISPVSGMDVNFRQMPFMVGFKGIDPQRAEDGEQLILETLSKLVSEGIPHQLITNALKRQEFNLKEQTWDTPVGLRAMSRIARGWLQGVKPHVTLGVSKALESLKALVEESRTQEGELFARDHTSKGYFEQWIVTNLLENPHRCLAIVTPDPSFNHELEEKINSHLSEVKERLGKGGLAQLRGENERFHQFEQLRDSLEDLAKVPSLTRHDLPETIRILEQTKQDLGGIPLYSQPMETNGIVYFDGLLRVDDLSEEETILLPLMSRLLLMTGIKELPYNDVAIKIRDKMGGLVFFLEGSTYLDSDATFLGLAFRLKCLKEEFPAALSLLGQILQEGNMDDTERLGAVLNDLVSNFESNITSSGHQYAAQRASANFSPLLKQNEMLGGLEQWFFLRDIDANREERLKEVGLKLVKLRDKIVERSRLILHLATNSELLPTCEKQLIPFIDSFPKGEVSVTNSKEVEILKRSGAVVELFGIPSTVSFNAMVCRSSAPTEASQVHQSLLATIITTGKLWDAVRSVGGAYGVTCSIDPLERLCAFTSYRDPRVTGTLDDFEKVLREVIEEGIEQDQLDAAIIATISSELRPISPQSRAFLAFRRALYHISDEYRSERRKTVLETTVEDLKEGASQILASLNTFKGVAIIGGEKVLKGVEGEVIPLL
ncbi:MAG: insulinase family protein [Sphaerochaetaceae bacterium]|nr:insulinase family protein [Sphaerochaetaceae bacterium]